MNPIIAERVSHPHHQDSSLSCWAEGIRRGLFIVAAVLSCPRASAQTETPPNPVGVYSLTIAGASDNVLSAPMVRDAVAVGRVAAPVGASSFSVTNGASGPGWTPSQFKYLQGVQSQTYYVEFTSGALRGLFYRIDDNGSASLALLTEGDDLTNHPLAGNPAAALVAGDAFVIRPFWRIRDVLEKDGAPIIEARPNAFTVKDDILLPNYIGVAFNKAPNRTIFYVSGQGWNSAGGGVSDPGNYPLAPNEAFILRRRNAAPLVLQVLGGVLTNRGISFLSGGDGASPNDTYVSIHRPVPVKLDDSGLRISDQQKSPIKDSPAAFNLQDVLLAFDSPAGFNRAPTRTFYYLTDQGWREFGSASTTVGQDFVLEPGKAYIVRKKAANPGVDWINDPNF
jgi:uncharacterized protein (TIGR02597 family)